MLKLYSFFFVVFLFILQSAHAITLHDLKDGFKLVDESYNGDSLNQEVITSQGKIGSIRREHFNAEEFESQKKSIEYRLYDGEDKLIAKTLMRSYNQYFIVEAYDENGIYLGSVTKRFGLLYPNFEIILPSQKKRIACNWLALLRSYTLFFTSEPNRNLLNISVTSFLTYMWPMAESTQINVEELEQLGMDPRLLLLIATCISEATFLDTAGIIAKYSCPNRNIQTDSAQAHKGIPITIDDISNGFLFNTWFFGEGLDITASNKTIGTVLKDYHTSLKDDFSISGYGYLLYDSNGGFLAQTTIKFTDEGVEIEIFDSEGFSLGVIKDNYRDSIYLFKNEFTIISPKGTIFTAQWNKWKSYYLIFEQSTSDQPFAKLRIPPLFGWTSFKLTNLAELKQYDLHPHLLILATACQSDEEMLRVLWDAKRN